MYLFVIAHYIKFSFGIFLSNLHFLLLHELNLFQFYPLIYPYDFFVCIYINIRWEYDKFPDVFLCALLLIVHTLNSSPLRRDLLQQQCTCCTLPTTSGRPHGSPLVWVCQWPSSQPLSSPQLSHNDSIWA